MCRFQCPECGFGDREIGHLAVPTPRSIAWSVEEQGRLVSIHCWDEDERDQARFGGALWATRAGQSCRPFPACRP